MCVESRYVDNETMGVRVSYAATKFIWKVKQSGHCRSLLKRWSIMDGNHFLSLPPLYGNLAEWFIGLGIKSLYSYMYKDIFNYISLLKEERQQHLDLSESCIEIGGNSRECRGVLAHFLKTTIPSGMKILLCHACNNGKCSNPKHLYWGTPKENMDDSGVREKGQAASRGRIPTNKGIKGVIKLSEETKNRMSVSRKRIPNRNPNGNNQYRKIG
jgi:hypothetical protein